MSEQRLSLGSDEINKVMAALTNLTICLNESGHTAEALEVDQTLRSILARLAASRIAK